VVSDEHWQNILQNSNSTEKNLGVAEGTCHVSGRGKHKTGRSWIQFSLGKKTLSPK
jgi:hypothetical protein